ncbi:insulinase family protein [Candidatus Nomurabacteria bacterium]|nr:insulinase family protein [Candidatus Nomurabacteria bacterium]MCB9803806.1 insulinase family protein [Candidatus Nomurabacteria bacterium]
MVVNDPTNGYLTTIIGYMIPFGSHNDPLGKEGLANVLVDSYNYGTTKFPDATKLFIELERTGAVFSAEAGREDLFIYLSVPRENVETAKQLLDHIIEDVLTTEEILEKIKKTISTKRDEIQSDDRSQASKTFKEIVFQERPILGTKESFLKINLDDVKDAQAQVISDRILFRLIGPDNIQIENKEYSHKRDLIKSKLTDRVRYLERDLEQKVLYLGYQTPGSFGTNYEVRQVASSIIYSGLTGIAMDRIRHDLSAAYYTAYSHDVLIDRGTAYLFAGLSEKNVPLVAKIMLEIYQDVRSGRYDEKQFDMAKAYFKGKLDRAYDSPSGVISLYLSYAIRGAPIPSYDDLVEGIAKVSKKDISELFERFLSKGQPYLVVNGSLSEETRTKLQDILSNA